MVTKRDDDETDTKPRTAPGDDKTTRGDGTKMSDKAAMDVVKRADEKGDPTVRAAAQRAEESARTSRSTAPRDAITHGRTRTSTSPDAKDVADEPDTAANEGIRYDETEDEGPLEIEATVVDNAYIELTIGEHTIELYEDEMHRLRKICDRAMIELPR